MSVLKPVEDLAGFWCALLILSTLAGPLHHPAGSRSPPAWSPMTPVWQALKQKWKEDQRSSYAPSHSSPLGTCYIKCTESPGIQATLPSNQSTHLKSPMENSAEPGAPLTCPPCFFLSQPCWHILSHTATGMQGPSRAAKLSDVWAANAALLRTR